MFWPWPMELLRGVGQSVIDGKTGAAFNRTGLEWMLQHPDIAEDQRKEAEQVAERIEEQFDRMHEEARRKLGKAMREGEIERTW